MKTSHADYMGEQVHRTLTILRMEYPVKMLAELAGCSPSLIYSWAESADDARAKYVLALAAGLAERQDYRLINLLLPVGAHVARRNGLTQPADGSADDEVTDGTIALAQAAMAHRGRNPEGIGEACELLRGVLRRLEEEGHALRAQQTGGGAA